MFTYIEEDPGSSLFVVTYMTCVGPYEIKPPPT